jgi:hypothetical protein
MNETYVYEYWQKSLDIKPSSYISELVEKNIQNNIIYELTNKPNIQNYLHLPEQIYEIKNVFVSKDTFLFKYKKRKLIYLKYYLKSLNDPKKYIYSIIHFYKYLLNTIQLLINYNIVHNNIFFDNILIDELGNPLLDNQKYMYNMSDTMVFTSQTNTSFSAPELVLVSYMKNNNIQALSLYNIEQIIDIIINNIPQPYPNHVLCLNNFKNNGLKYFEKYVNKSYEYIIKDIIKYSHTWDNFSLSLLQLKICIDINTIHYSESEPTYLQNTNNFIILFMKLLVQNISIDPNNRLSIEDTTNKFNDILINVSIDEYNNLIYKLNNVYDE